MQFTLTGGWSRRLLVGTTWLGIVAGAYFWGRHGSVPEATAAPVAPVGGEEESSPVPSGRIVAYIHGSIPITREELGEYLIARHGKDKVKHLINKRIIEQAAKSKGVEVAAGELTAALNADALAAGARTVKEFNDAILKRYGKTPYEWREDVVKPRLVLEKMCRARVSVTGEDIAKAYEAHYGEKIDCQMLLFPREEKNHVLNKVWPAVRKSEKDFDHYARCQASPTLAAVAGHIKPIGHHTTGSERLEKVLFSLRPSEVSEVLDEPEGLVILKYLKHIEPQAVPLAAVKDKLEKEVFDKKVALEIGKLFQELLAQAKPDNFLDPSDTVKDVKKLLGEDVKDPSALQPVPGSTPVPPPATPPTR